MLFEHFNCTCLFSGPTLILIFRYRWYTPGKCVIKKIMFLISKIVQFCYTPYYCYDNNNILFSKYIFRYTTQKKLDEIQPCYEEIIQRLRRINEISNINGFKNVLVRMRNTNIVFLHLHTSCFVCTIANRN